MLCIDEWIKYSRLAPAFFAMLGLFPEVNVKAFATHEPRNADLVSLKSPFAREFTDALSVVPADSDGFMHGDPIICHDSIPPIWFTG